LFPIDVTARLAALLQHGQSRLYALTFTAIQTHARPMCIGVLAIKEKDYGLGSTGHRCLAQSLVVASHLAWLPDLPFKPRRHYRALPRPGDHVDRPGFQPFGDNLDYWTLAPEPLPHDSNPLFTFHG